ncbi:hypothetical protein TcasGA2_TC013406 [Tribolium castaneum]|uniref:Uncharacterized protein n=1 Tax=Tribolium castaneum TaxID=7070 RepID=D6WLQ7_TRICA|nr:hypothetical protein TcasGA2_TC013406 [Tribolium castaneum]
MSERKFARGLGKPGTAAQLRETVSQVVKENTELLAGFLRLISDCFEISGACNLAYSIE